MCAGIRMFSARHWGATARARAVKEPWLKSKLAKIEADTVDLFF